jgi:anti-anti-sigma factor
MTTFAVEQSTPPGRDHVTFSTDWETASSVRISATGDIDATNAAQFAEYVLQRSANCLQLVIDLRAIDFFGSAGLTALLTIGERCGRADVSWAVIPSRAVSRVLDICDPEQTLPRATG